MEVPKETKKTHVLVGGVGQVKDYSYAFYNPHNARYYFGFDKKTFNHLGLGGVGVPCLLINKKDFVLKSFFGCRIVVRKTLVEVTNKVNKDRLFKIDGNVNDRRLQVIDAVTVLENECVNALREFVVCYGGFSDFKCEKSWIPDNKIIHDKIIDAVSVKDTFRNEVVKKVYNETPSNVEYSDPAFAANAFRNLGLYDYAPQIADGLNVLKENLVLLRESSEREFLKFRDDALIPLTAQIKLHLRVQRNTLKVQREMSKSLKSIEVAKCSVELSGEDRVKRLKYEWGW